MQDLPDLMGFPGKESQQYPSSTTRINAVIILSEMECGMYFPFQTPKIKRRSGIFSYISLDFLGIRETPCTESSERLLGRSVCCSEHHVVSSVPEYYFVKYSSSEGTDIGAANNNWT